MRHFFAMTGLGPRWKIPGYASVTPAPFNEYLAGSQATGAGDGQVHRSPQRSRTANAPRSVPARNVDLLAALDVEERNVECIEIHERERPRRIDARQRNGRAGIHDHALRASEPNWRMRVSH